ncbi:Transcription factor iws1 [Exophiala xenobiotica]|nr:Transcription factor iws1 [Exophiala xenobiotica]KAK5242904.1 Transcription factor iws1 [Exophiala xenobiotica]KAK5356218.1 Transcription factor iws1 [Exophiala xenobiotica]
MADSPGERPPSNAEGLDRPSENEAQLDDLHDEFDEPSRVEAADAAGPDSDDESLFPKLTKLTIKVKKRKRAEGEDEAPKKKKVEQESGLERTVEDKTAMMAFLVKQRPRVAIDEKALSPEEQRRRALDQDMDASVKKSSAKKIRKGDIDLEQAADQEIEEMRNRMIAAAEADGELSILDPQTSLLEAVRFFLEPLSDGSLQAYNIQRELFAALAKLPMNKQTLISSGVGKVMLFYRKSRGAEPAIKRQATKLMEEWSRLVLQISDENTKKTWARATYDPTKRRDDLGQPAIVPKATAKVAPGVYKKDVDSSRANNSTLQILIQAILNGEEEDVMDLMHQIRTCDSLEELATAIEAQEKGPLEDPANSQMSSEEPTVEAELSGEMGDLMLDGSVKFIGGTSNLIWYPEDYEQRSLPSLPAHQQHVVAPRKETILSWTTVTQDKELVLHFMNMYFCWHYAIFTALAKELFYRDFLTG